MNEADLHYPPDVCPFCNIAAAFPCPESSLWSSRTEDLGRCVPGEAEANYEKTSPSSFVVLRSRDVVAFLDILPMTGGHLLVTTRGHKVKVADMGAVESREIGFWLPILARTVANVTGVTDYNIVQNNGARAAQVVPHVHFHIIPRPGTMPEIKNKSWTMFGRGQRDDLDDEEGAKIASEMRKVLREEIEKMSSGEKEAKL
ncbi:Nn.00g017330.m01.CDS01 [Neocucurbitaria sp. VM-36]